MKFVELFHAWGDLLLARHLAKTAENEWAEALATRWTMLTAWACFELGCHLILGRDHRSQRLSPGFWRNLNQELTRRGVATIDSQQPPWDGWQLIQEERHLFAHLGPGGGRFSKSVDADLAVSECAQALHRFFTRFNQIAPCWISGSSVWPERSPFDLRGSGMGIGGSITLQNASPSDPSTIRLAIIQLDGTEHCDYYPSSYSWEPRFDSILNNLGGPIKGLRVYDANKVFKDEPLVMWGA